MRFFTAFILTLVLAFPLTSVQAQDYESGTVDIIPASPATSHLNAPDSQDAEFPTVHLTPDKSELIRLERNATSVVVGNPQHLNVLAENSRTLVLVPRMPGATYISVLDVDGNPIMQRHVIVAAPKNNYVRIRRSCAGSKSKGCQSTQVYYCPGMCHEIGMNIDGEAGNPGSVGGGGAPSAQQAGNTPRSDDDLSNENEIAE